MRNTIILTAILFIAVIAATIYYFKDLDKDHNQSARPLRFLPQNTLFIAAIGNDESAQNVFKDFEIFDAVLGFNDTKLWSAFRTNILNNEKVKNFTEGSDIYISFHPDKKQIIPLFTIPTSQAIPTGEFTTLLNEISKNYKVSTIDTLNHKIYQIKYGEKDSILNAFYYNDIVFATTSLSLVAKIVDKHSKHLSEEQIEFFLKAHPRNSPLSVYFPHQQFDSIVNLTQRNDNGPFLNLFKKLHGQSAWNINFKENALILTGESQLDQYPENYATIFKNQQKTKQGLYKYFPSNTAVYAEFSVSNRPKFQKDLHDLFKRREEKIVENIDTTKATEIFSQALGDQFALTEINNQEQIGYINIQDNSKFKELANLVLESTSDSIGRFLKAGFLYKQYGDIFKDLQRPYFTVIDSVLVVANNLSTLREYRKDYLKNDLLTGTLGYIKLEKLQSNEANITFFIHSRNANSKILNALNQPFKDNFKDKDNFGFQDFFSWSIQLSGNNGNMASQIYAIYKSTNTLGITPEWTVALNNKAITQPYIFNQSDTSQMILIQELNHTLYAINPYGQKIWSKVLAGRIISDIQQLEDRSIILVTDKNNLYKLDTEGNSQKGFPINIQNKPTTMPLLTNLKTQKAILIPTEKSILAYDLQGNTIKDWNKLEVEGMISTKILIKDKQIIVGTSTGNIYWINENGQKTSEIRLQNAIDKIHLMDNYKIVVLDTKGKLHLFDQNNKHTELIISNDASNFFAAFTNISNTNNSNLAFINSNQLYLYNITDSLQKVFQHSFTKPIVDELQFFASAEDKNLHHIGVASKATNLVYLFDGKGQSIDGFPVEGQPLFYYGKINYNSDIYLLCMRRDHKLYAFKQQK